MNASGEISRNTASETAAVDMHSPAAPAASHNGKLKRVRPEAMARHSGIVLLGTLLGRGINFLAQVVLSKLLGLRDFGMFTYGSSLLNFLDGVCLGGFSHTTVRYLAVARAQARPADIRHVMQVALLVIGALTLIVSTSFFFFREAFAERLIRQPEIAQVLPWLALTLPVLVFLSWLGFALRGFREVSAEVLIRRVLQPAGLLLFVGAITWFTALNVHWAMAALLASTLISTVFGMVKLWPHVPKASPERATVPTRDMLKFTVRVWFSRFSGLVMNQADRLMIGALSSLSQVGIYHAAFRIADFQTLAMGSFVPMFSTVIAEAHGRNDQAAIVHYYRMVVRWSLLVTFPICLACWVFAEPILRLFGEEFVAGVPVLLTIAFASLVDAGVGPAGQFLQMMNREKWEMRFLIGAALTAVAANAVLIPKYGAMGAAIGSGLAIVGLNLARLFALRTVLGVFPYTPVTARLLLICVLSYGAAILAAPLGMWLQAAILMGVYGAGVLLLCLEKDDRAMLQRLKSKLRGRV